MSCFETIDWAEFGGAVLTNINQARYGTFIRRAKRKKVSNLPVDQLVIKPRTADRSIYDEGRDCVLTDTQRGDVGQVVDWLTPSKLRAAASDRSRYHPGIISLFIVRYRSRVRTQRPNGKSRIDQRSRAR